jgi:hypothetical protein
MRRRKSAAALHERALVDLRRLNSAPTPSEIRKQDIRRIATARDAGAGTSAAIPSLNGDVVRARVALQKLLGEVRVVAEVGGVYAKVETRADRLLLDAVGAMKVQ